jgi:hypothetical protein
MRTSTAAVIALMACFALVFLSAYLARPHYPMLIIGGEASVGTWMSGVLLIMCATLSLVIGTQRSFYPWLLFFVFFILLAIDERFMFHEALKQHIIFAYGHGKVPSRWLYEIPVIAGALFGAFMATLLWRYLRAASRPFLILVALLGAASVTIDVLSAGLLWEECFKLLAELTMACVLLREL